MENLDEHDFGGDASHTHRLCDSVAREIDMWTSGEVEDLHSSRRRFGARRRYHIVLLAQVIADGDRPEVTADIASEVAVMTRCRAMTDGERKRHE